MDDRQQSANEPAQIEEIDLTALDELSGGSGPVMNADSVWKVFR